MKRLSLFSILLAALLSFCGCRGLQSELEKSALRKAGPTVEIDGTTFKLTSSLKRSMSSDGKRFDLSGDLVIAPDIGSFPENIEVCRLALRPDATGAYVINFFEEHGIWLSVDGDKRFSGNTTIGPDRRTIHLQWQNLRGNPKHFATYTVSVSLSDSKKKRYVLTNLNVPTD
jgi:hypothetical protein